MAALLDAAAVDDVVLAGDGGAVITSQEEQQPRHLHGQDMASEALHPEEFLFVLRRDVETLLLLGVDGAGKEAVDAYVRRSEIVGHGAGHPGDSRFGGNVN